MQPILIAGGGIGGLTLAIALARRGIASQVLETRAEPPVAGAGIQLGPNATRLLYDLQLGDALAPYAVAPQCILVHDGAPDVAGKQNNNRRLARLPLGPWIEQTHGAPYWVIHRADLAKVLWQAARAEPLIEMRTGQPVVAVDDGNASRQIAVSLADGSEVAGAVLVGADGLWSRVREYVNPAFSLSYSGISAARALVPRANLGAPFSEQATGVWLAPDAHVVHYPVAGGETVAIVAIVRGAEPSEGWNSAVDSHEIRARFAQLPAIVCEFIEKADEWRQWPLYVPDSTGPWTRGRAILIGDAAHPILPFLAQGGGLAIEDACVLAAAIADQGICASDDANAAADATAQEQIAELCSRFWQRRRQRVTKVQQTSAGNGRVYHLSGPAALARNLALRTLPGRYFMRRYDWIYGFRA